MVGLTFLQEIRYEKLYRSAVKKLPAGTMFKVKPLINKHVKKFNLPKIKTDFFLQKITLDMQRGGLIKKRSHGYIRTDQKTYQEHRELSTYQKELTYLKKAQQKRQKPSTQNRDRKMRLRELYNKTYKRKKT